MGPKYGFYSAEFGEGRNPLELAYYLTVHKTQGSQFKVTFVVLNNPSWLLSRACAPRSPDTKIGWLFYTRVRLPNIGAMQATNTRRSQSA